MNDKTKTIPEIVILKGYSLDEILDMDDDLLDEEPIVAEEVRIHFE